jgi:hypothetical protein
MPRAISGYIPMPGNSDDWPRLPDEMVSALPEHEQLLIRQHEEETIAASKMQLSDICLNCRVKPQFAKTYRVLRRDLGTTLDAMRAQIAQPNSDISDAYGVALIRSTDAIVSHKLDLMRRQFFVRWGESVRNWAGEEGGKLDKSGCCILFLLFGAGIGFTGWLVFSLTA